jgi:hypothetical protein
MKAIEQAISRERTGMHNAYEMYRTGEIDYKNYRSITTYHNSRLCGYESIREQMKEITTRVAVEEVL